MQAATIAKKPRKQAISGRFWAGRTYRGRIKDDHKIDPCSGSGHIVVYAFDILVQIYQEYGFSQREAAEQIVKNNIYALDIDERAVQLTYFSIMMKARQYDRRFFTKKIQPNVYRILSLNAVCKLLWYSADLSTLTGLILFIRYVLLDIVLRAIEFLIIYIVYEYKTLIQQSESPWNYSNHQTVYLLPTGYGFASLPSSRFALCAEHSVFLNS